MRLLANIRERIGAAIAAVGFAICLFIFGAILAFVVSPQQAVEWRQIQNLPAFDAATVAGAETGTEIVISGTLTDNEVIFGDRYVVYERDEWEVDAPSDSEDEPDGSWREIEQDVPALMITVSGGTVQTTPGDSATNLAGNLHEEIEQGSGRYSDSYNGQTLKDGAIRTQGFANGDLVTVHGTKASTGAIAPKRLFGGDRVQLVEHIRRGARAAFIGGIAMMICAPIVLVGGILGGLLGRNR